MKNTHVGFLEMVKMSAVQESWHRTYGPCGPEEEGCETCYGRRVWKKAPIWILMLEEIVEQLRMWTWRVVLRCDHKGHWHDEGYGGPGSGAVGGHCDRCGDGFYETLY
jgi:hypothetical protein